METLEDIVARKYQEGTLEHQFSVHERAEKQFFRMWEWVAADINTLVSRFKNENEQSDVLCVSSLSLLLYMELLILSAENVNSFSREQLLYAYQPELPPDVPTDEITRIVRHLREQPMEESIETCIKSTQSFQFAQPLNTEAIYDHLLATLERINTVLIPLERRYLSYSDDEITLIFLQQKHRYYQQNQKSIDNFVRRSSKVAAPFALLEEVHADSPLVQKYKLIPDPTDLLRAAITEHKYVENDLIDLYDYLIKHEQISQELTSSAPKPSPQQPSIETTPLPHASQTTAQGLKLNSMQKRCFQLAVEQGMMEGPDGDGHYQWNRTDALLSYFLGRVFCGDTSSPGGPNQSPTWLKGDKRFANANVLSTMFNTKDIGKPRRDRRTPPQGYEEVDALFHS